VFFHAFPFLFSVSCFSHFLEKAAKLKVIKTLNEFNILSSQQTLGNKFGVIVFFSGENAAAWKSTMSDLNDLAGDFFDHASFIGVDVRFFQQIVDQVCVSSLVFFSCFFKRKNCSVQGWRE
jgi:hypothetical protein